MLVQATGNTEEEAKWNVTLAAERMDHDEVVDRRLIKVYYYESDQLWHAEYITGNW